MIHSSFKYHWKITNNFFLKFPQFSSILCGFPRLFQSVQNSLTFPWLENAFPFFQVFQSEWEPWIIWKKKRLILSKKIWHIIVVTYYYTLLLHFPEFWACPSIAFDHDDTNLHVILDTNFWRSFGCTDPMSCISTTRTKISSVVHSY